jgi:hypothetical protein
VRLEARQRSWLQAIQIASTEGYIRGHYALVVLCGGRSWVFGKVEERRPGKQLGLSIKQWFPSVVYCRN